MTFLLLFVSAALPAQRGVSRSYRRSVCSAPLSNHSGVCCEHPQDRPAVSDARREQACDLLHILQIADGGEEPCLQAQRESGGQPMLKSPSLSSVSVPVPKHCVWWNRLDHRVAPGLPLFNFCDPGIHCSLIGSFPCRECWDHCVPWEVTQVTPLHCNGQSDRDIRVANTRDGAGALRVQALS